MLMVEHFTKEEQYASLTKEVLKTENEADELFEEKLKVILNQITIEPKTESINAILNFSKSLSK